MSKQKAIVAVKERPMVEASKIDPDSVRWTVLIQVMERRQIRKSKIGGDFRNYTVTDMQGTKVPMVAFGKDVFQFEDTLLPYNRYKVSNAIVKFTPANWRVLPYPCTWTIHKRILIEPYADPVPHPLPCTFAFDRFSDLYQHADQPRNIFIKAMIVRAFPVRVATRTTSYRDYIVINEEMIPMLLRVWDDLLQDSDVNVYAKYKHPIMIVAYGLKVTTYNSLSISTRDYVYFMQDPPLNETCPLRDWYVAHSEQIQQMVDAYAWRDTSLLFRPPRRGEIISLENALATIESVKTVWTEGRLTLFPGQRKLWMQVYEECYTEVDAEGDSSIWCMCCKKRTEIVIRGDIIVYLTNGSRTIQATIKSPDFEKLLPFNPREVMEAALQGTPMTAEVEAALREKHVICFLKYYDTKAMGVSVRRYPIPKVYTEEDIHTYYDQQAAPPQTQDSTILYLEGSQNETGSSSVTATITTEKQFFSPGTKNALEDIMNGPSLDDIPADCSTGVKRMLQFEDTPEKEMDTTKSAHATSSTPLRTPKSENTLPATAQPNLTPKKKSKPEEPEQ